MDKRVIWGVIISSVIIIVGGIYFAGRTKPAVPGLDTPATTSTPKELEITSSDHVQGNADALITLVEYGDFQCPSCAAYNPLTKQLKQEFGDKLRFVFRHYPLTQIHEHAWAAAKASEAANKQGKFWEMYTMLFEKQADWSKTKDELAIFSEYAKILGLNVDTFKKDFASSDVENRVHIDQVTGDSLGVNGTPTFYVNGRLINLPGSYDAFKGVITGALNSVTPKPTSAVSEIHEHMDIALYVGGKKVSLSSKAFNEKNPDIHIHDANGDIVHQHKPQITLGTFWDSLELKTPKPTVMYLNGKKYDGSWTEYVFKDLDRVTLSTTELNATQIGLVGDKACIYSEKCPERGKPPTETCVGGLGTDCVK